MDVPERLQKHLPIVGARGIRTIRRTRLAIVGVSGNGSPFALLAALVGFRRITLIDPDRLEESNRNRFVFGGWRDVGRYKVDVAKEHLDLIERGMDCVALPVDVRSREGQGATRRAGVVVGAVDSNAVRGFLQEQCASLKKPLLDLGSGGLVQEGVIRMLGSRVSFYLPGGACLFHQTLDANEVGLSPVSLATPNFVAAAVGLELLLSWLTGYGDRVNFALYDSLVHGMVSMNIVGREDCRYCQGTASDEGAGRRTT